MEHTARPAAEVDLDLLLAMMHDFYAHFGSAFDEPPRRTAVLELLHRPELGWIWLIELGGAPVGYLVVTLGYSLERDGRIALLDELYVAPEQRGRGIGTWALRQVEAACRDAGAILLEVDLENEGAYRLYRALGFDDLDRRVLALRLTRK